MKRIGSKDGLAYQSYSVNTFGTGSYVQDEGGLKHTLPIVEESADERPDSISERTSNTRRVNQTDLDSPPSRRSSTTVQPSRPRSPPSASELVPSPPLYASGGKAASSISCFSRGSSTRDNCRQGSGPSVNHTRNLGCILELVEYVSPIIQF